MNVIIPSLNVKVFAKALYALAKVGENIYVEGNSERISFVALNLRKTVCVRYIFFDSFFSSYQVNGDEGGPIGYKTQVKTLLPLFKGTHLEKKLDFVKIEYDNGSDLVLFKMKYKCDDILMIHKLRLLEPETLSIQLPVDGQSNIVCSSSLCIQLSNMFSNSDDEITLEVSKQKVIARNYYIGSPVKPKSVRSQVNLNESEFSNFRIDGETTINFSLKPFRTAVQFADAFNLNMGLNFEKGGKPLAIVMKNPSFEVNFIVATIDPYNDNQSSGTSIPTKITQLNSERINMTVEDQQALLTENWDDNFNTDSDENLKNQSNKKHRPNFEELLAKANNIENNNFRQKKGNKTKKFALLSPFTENIDREGNNYIPSSPESPMTKKAKLVFGRCFESTFSAKNLGDILAPNSDSE